MQVLSNMMRRILLLSLTWLAGLLVPAAAQTAVQAAANDAPTSPVRVACAVSHAFAPNIVLIKLGTNDMKPYNWVHHAKFEAELRALIDIYRVIRGKWRPELMPDRLHPSAAGATLMARRITTYLQRTVRSAK